MDAANARAANSSARAYSGARRWLATAAASFITAYALDLFATCLGLLAVASGLLSGLAYVEALLLLIASYVFWGSGLWAVLKANWALLQRTGACTNILAKAGHDLAVRLGWSLRGRKAAAYVGNTATEISRAVDSIGADLLVVGVPKRGVVSRALFGSTTARVLSKIRVPVLAVPDVGTASAHQESTSLQLAA